MDMAGDAQLVVPPRTQAGGDLHQLSLGWLVHRPDDTLKQSELEKKSELRGQTRWDSAWVMALDVSKL